MVISIHAPRAGCDADQDDLPVPPFDFNPRTPCGVRLLALGFHLYRGGISIHAPRAGCDFWHWDSISIEEVFQSTHPVRGATSLYLGISTTTLKFQSTHPVRGATALDNYEVADVKISIHAPRAGCDRARRHHGRKDCHFNPRTPCGVRRAIPPHWGLLWTISIHAPRAGCDALLLLHPLLPQNFNPRTPCGVRPPFISNLDSG